MVCLEGALTGSQLRRIAIVYPFTNLDTVPSLCNMAEILADNGYLVEIFTKFSPEFLPPIFENPNIYIHMPYPPRWERKGLHRILPAHWSQSLTLHARHKEAPYHAFIGVDPQGLIQAERLARFNRAPLIYYSLELLLNDEVGEGAYKSIKEKEIRLSRQAAFIIIQDQDRARLLAKDNVLSIEKFVYVPNSPLGLARRQKNSYWHQKFGLTPETKIVLHAGSIGEWTGIDGIVESVRDWPENYVLVIHTRFSPGTNFMIQLLQQRALPGKVFFSLDPVSRQQYDQVMDGADIGIAFYQWVAGNVYFQQNIFMIGLSSGKAAYTMRAGLPLIVSKGIGLPGLIERCGAGLVVENFSQIGTAISQIDQAYYEYSAAALNLFNAHLNFSTAFQGVLERLNGLLPV